LGQRKHRFKANKMDFSFNRICDLHPVGNRIDGALTVSVVTPLAEEYELYNEGRCIGASGDDGGQVLIKLNDDETVGRELRTYLKTEKYLRNHEGTLTPTSLRIHRDLADENRNRRERLTASLRAMMEAGSYFVAGQSFDAPRTSAQAAVDGALEYLIQN